MAVGLLLLKRTVADSGLKCWVLLSLLLSMVMLEE